MATATQGERRIVSVVFADLSGSTSIAEQLGPERAKFLLDEVIRKMTGAIQRYEGTVAQLLGDGVMALFGTPVAHEDDGERAVRAALAIQDALRSYAEDVRVAYDVDLGVRVAVNTGPVVVTTEGRPEADRYNALGDTVNVAARLQALADGGVVIGAATARAVGDLFALEPLGAAELRGRDQPVETYRVAGERRTCEDFAAPLVGREFELSVLGRVTDDLVEGLGSIVVVTGEPGIGKSRLITEALRPVGDRVRLLEGSGLSYAVGFPLWPVREVLRNWLRVGVATSEARIRLDLKAELARLFDDDGSDIYPFVASVLDLPPEPQSDPLRELSREARQRRTFHAVQDLLCRLSRERPLCLVFEDLHWADDSTLDLVAELFDLTELEAVTIVLLYRSERERRSWSLGEQARQRYPHRFRELELGPLPADAGMRLAAAVAGGQLPDEVEHLLADRAGGNPFFLEEAVRDLMERGALTAGTDGWTLAVGPDELTVPTVVQGTLQARLDRLSPETRGLLNVAAVAGRTFGLPLLERVCETDNVPAALSELQRLELIVEQRRRPAPEYRFRHGLVQEVAYASLLETRRRDLHLQVAEALEQMTAEDGEVPVQVLARHFAEADDAERAAHYLLLAGDAARGKYAGTEAIAHYRHARKFLARLGDERRSRETLFKIALVHHLAFQFEQAESAYDEAFSCRAEDPVQLEPTERMTAVIGKSGDLIPGAVYFTEIAAITELLFRGLLRVDRELNVMPSLADNFRVSGDGLEYLFQLRPGLTWSDGEPLTAHDFVYTWTRMRELGETTAFLLEDVAEAEALDDRTLRVALAQPRNYFPYLLALPATYPWPQHMCERVGDAWRDEERLVSSGPYRLVRRDDAGMTMEANPLWVGARGNLREVEIVFGPHATERVDALARWKEGQYDLMQMADRHPLEQLDDTVVETIPPLCTTLLQLNSERPGLVDTRVRAAILAAIDVERLHETVPLAARAAVGSGLLPPAMPGYAHRLQREGVQASAEELLSEAGHPGGSALPELLLTSWDSLADVAEFIRGELAKVGIRVRIHIVSHGGVASGETDLCLQSWVADYPDPDGVFRGLLHGASWRIDPGPDIEQMLERARSLQDQDARLQLYREIDRALVVTRAVALPLAYPRRRLLRRPWLKEVFANSMSTVDLGEAVVEGRP
jgi:ABC-type oligopeptide transport system substrate-binding subunit/class 3 adenylate cyclase